MQSTPSCRWAAASPSGDEGGNQHAIGTFLPLGSRESVRWLRTNVFPLSKSPSTATTAPSHPSIGVPDEGGNQHAISMPSIGVPGPSSVAALQSACTRHALDMQSACNRHAISMQSACNQHAISTPGPSSVAALGERGAAAVPRSMVRSGRRSMRSCFLRSSPSISSSTSPSSSSSSSRLTFLRNEGATEGGSPPGFVNGFVNEGATEGGSPPGFVNGFVNGSEPRT